MTEVLPRRLVVIDDDEDVRDLLQLLIELDPRFDLVGLAHDGVAGVTLAASLLPDAVILDLDLPHANGIEVIAQIRKVSPSSRVVVFSAFPDPFTLVDVLRSGADDYLAKGSAWSEVLPAVAALLATHSHVS
jgi:DNA-binding NarL/FixJ family response regulator